MTASPLSPWLVEILGTLYVLAGFVTTGLLLPLGLRSLRVGVFTNRLHPAIGWILAPFGVLVMIGLGLVTLYLMLTVWPVVAIVFAQRRARRRSIDRALDAEDEAELLREARRARARRRSQRTHLQAGPSGTE